MNSPKVISEILAIAAEYHEQEASGRGVDTPGGVEHRGDFWRLILKWEKMLSAHTPETPSKTTV